MLTSFTVQIYGNFPLFPIVVQKVIDPCPGFCGEDACVFVVSQVDDLSHCILITRDGGIEEERSSNYLRLQPL